MQENILVQFFWVVCVATAIVASVLAIWRPRARYIGRVAVSVLMLLGGAVFNAVNLARGDYASFRRPGAFRLGDRCMACGRRAEPVSVYRLWWRSKQSSEC